MDVWNINRNKFMKTGEILNISMEVLVGLSLHCILFYALILLFIFDFCLFQFDAVSRLRMKLQSAIHSAVLVILTVMKRVHVHKCS